MNKKKICFTTCLEKKLAEKKANVFVLSSMLPELCQKCQFSKWVPKLTKSCQIGARKCNSARYKFWVPDHFQSCQISEIWRPKAPCGNAVAGERKKSTPDSPESVVTHLLKNRIIGTKKNYDIFVRWLRLNLVMFWRKSHCSLFKFLNCLY